MHIQPTPDCIIADGAIGQIPGALAALRVETVLVITDRGVIKAGIFDKIKAVLDKAGICAVVCDRVEPDPSVTLLQSIVEEIRLQRVGAVIGLGGGSSLDTAKVAAALVTNKRDISDYLAGVSLSEEPLPILAVPTTAGTGSETTNIAILSDEKDQLKKAIVSPKIIPRYAFLDPELTLGLPALITAVTGMDAICHAIESYTSVNATPFTETLSLSAVELLDANILEAFRNGSNRKAREGMLLGSFMAGIAFANAGVTAVHAFAYPLGGMFHVPHGLANSLMLPTVMRFNSVACGKRFARIAQVISGDASADADTLIRRVEELSLSLQLPPNLAAIKIPADSLEKMADAAILITRLLKNNPRRVTLDDARAIYNQAYRR